MSASSRSLPPGNAELQLGPCGSTTALLISQLANELRLIIGGHKFRGDMPPPPLGCRVVA